MDKKPVILIIDDEQDIRDMVKIKLEADGFEVKEAKDGKEGLEAAKKIKPDLVLLDIVMPVMDGIDALLEMRKIDALKNTKIFLFTSKGNPGAAVQEEDQQFVKENGAVGIIRKEVNLDELVKKLQGALS